VCVQGQFSTKSDVWSFGVTLWEILTHARDRPLPTLSDSEVVTNLERVGRACDDVTDNVIVPSRPQGCPRETYDLMRECWCRDVERRPSFREAHMFLQRLNAGYSPVVDEDCATGMERHHTLASAATPYLTNHVV
jgi:serine/threonine protein kinase